VLYFASWEQADEQVASARQDGLAGNGKSSFDGKVAKEFGHPFLAGQVRAVWQERRVYARAGNKFPK